MSEHDSGRDELVADGFGVAHVELSLDVKRRPVSSTLSDMSYQVVEVRTHPLPIRLIDSWLLGLNAKIVCQNVSGKIVSDRVWHMSMKSGRRLCNGLTAINTLSKRADRDAEGIPGLVSAVWRGRARRDGRVVRLSVFGLAFPVIGCNLIKVDGPPLGKSGQLQHVR
jgi:hypothetical protein